MTREGFIKKLKDREISYETKGGKVIITHGRAVFLDDIDSIPSDVEFNNKGSVYLYGIKSLPSRVIFNNEGDIIMDSLMRISREVEFNNNDEIRLTDLTGDWFWEWEGNIEGIGENRLLNKMISLGLFER